MGKTNVRGGQIADGTNGVDLTVDVTGTLPRGNGGTGLATSGSNGNLLTSNGTNWTSAAPASVNLASGVTGTLPHGNGGTDVTSPGTSGNVLTSDGTNWTSADPLPIKDKNLITQQTGITTATQVLSSSIPASTLKAHTQFRVVVTGNRATSDTNATTIVVTCGTAGTTADGTVVSGSLTHTAVANQAFTMTFDIVCRAIGTNLTTMAGTCEGTLITNATSSGGAVSFIRGIASTLTGLSDSNAMFLGVNVAHPTNAVTIDHCSIEVVQQ